MSQQGNFCHGTYKKYSNTKCGKVRDVVCNQRDSKWAQNTE